MDAYVWNLKVTCTNLTRSEIGQVEQKLQDESGSMNGDDTYKRGII